MRSPLFSIFPFFALFFPKTAKSRSFGSRNSNKKTKCKQRQNKEKGGLADSEPFVSAVKTTQELVLLRRSDCRRSICGRVIAAY